jgi:multidrug resistance protein
VTPSAPRNRGLLLVLLSLASFSVIFNNLIVAPLLPALADDLDVSIAVAGLSVTGYAITAGIIAIGAGPLIDRIGRKPIVVVSMCTLALGTGLSALAPNFPLFMVARGIAGLGAASLMPAVLAFVGDYFAYEERAKAMGSVIATNSTAAIVGVPIGAVVGDVTSWRVAFVALAALTALIAFFVARILPSERRDAQRPRVGAASAIAAVLRDGPTAATIASLFLYSASWFVIGTYFAAFYHDEYGLPGWALGSVAMISGAGIFAGGMFGGRICDRYGSGVCCSSRQC